LIFDCRLPIADLKTFGINVIGNRIWQSAMRFKYSKFQGFDVSSINLGELMDSMSDALLDSGYDDDYYWTRQRKTTIPHSMRSAVRCFRP
jgi:hypothetical protein